MISNVRAAAPDLVDWVLREATRLEMPAVMEGLARRLVALGLPLHRFSIGMRVLNTSLLAAGFVWRPDWPLEYTRFDFANRDSGMYERSPFKVAQETGKWVHLDLSKVSDEDYGIVPTLRAENIAHYYAVPLPAASDQFVMVTIATRDPENFTAEQCDLIDALSPVLTLLMQHKRLQADFAHVLSAYVGREPARRILSGTVHRGEVTEMRAAILVADLRGFTHLSTQLPPQSIADVINAYYDIVVPAIAERGGEILKFIGDAVLAVFPCDAQGETQAILSALDAARAALASEGQTVEVGGRAVAIHFGIAIHVGAAVYGNVGSGERLDYTVIGRDVNVAARIAALCSRLGQSYLVSDEVAAVGRANDRLMAFAGEHEVRGLDTALRVHVPDVETLPPGHDDGVSQGLMMAPTA